MVGKWLYFPTIFLPIFLPKVWRNNAIYKVKVGK